MKNQNVKLYFLTKKTNRLSNIIKLNFLIYTG